MEENVLSLIYDYSIENEVMDKEYIIQLIDIIIKYDQLEKYVLQVSINESCGDNAEFAKYDSNSKQMMINYSTFNKLLNQMDNSCFNEKETGFNKNISLTQIILHELEYANQQKIMFEKNNLDSDLLKLSQTKDSCLKYYDLSLCERFAELKSYSRLLKLIEPIKEEIPSVQSYQELLKIRTLINGYSIKNNHIICPTLSYIELCGNKDKLSYFDWYKEDELKCLKLLKQRLSYMSRLNYGLLIDNKEYESINTTYLLKLCKFGK